MTLEEYCTGRIRSKIDREMMRLYWSAFSSSCFDYIPRSW